MTVREILNNENLKERLMNLVKQELPFALTINPPGFHHIDLMYDDVYDEFHSIERQQHEHSNNGMLYLGMIKAERLDPPIEDLDYWAKEIFEEEEYHDLCPAEQYEVLEAEYEVWFDGYLDEEWEEILQNIVRDTLYHEENPS
jgi:hypothetical protein